MLSLIRHVKLLAIRENTYTMYVFQDLDNREFIMCTKLPNWQTPDISVGAEGYVQYNVVKAGDVYYNPLTDTEVKYNYTNSYYVNFVHKSEKINNEGIII